MEYQVKISKEAERDLQTAKCFYRISGLEKEFDRDFLNQLGFFKANPYLFQIYYRSIRKVHFRNFGYSIHYLVLDQCVLILRILHCRQDYG